MTLLGRLLPHRPGHPHRSGRRDAVRTVRTVRRLVWRHRVALAAICCGLAVAGTVQALRPAPPPSSPVLVTARPVPAGTRLTGDDVVRREVATHLAPRGVLRREPDAAGRTAVVRLPAGVPLHTGVLSDGGVLSSAPDGRSVVPVTLADDGVAALLRPGDRVDLITPGGGGPLASAPGAAEQPSRYLARRALVLPTPESRAAGDDAAGGLLDPAAEAPAVTLVAVRPDDAPDLSAIAGTGAVSAILVP